MTDYRPAKGFQDAFAPPAPRRGKRERPVLSGGGGARSASPAAKARLARVVTKAPEVMVKITGRTKDAGHLRAHLEYISRNGEIPVETRDGAFVVGRPGVHEFGDGWRNEVEADPRHRANSPYSVNIILSMPPGTDPHLLKDAVRAFAGETFRDRFDYVFAYHDDTRHPHVHLTVRPFGDNHERLNPRKADLEQWRQTFAQKLRDRGVAAEATPRRARGVTLKAQKTPVRKMIEKGTTPNVLRQARIEAGRAAFGRDTDLRPWEAASRARQQEIRSIYLREAKDLAASSSAEDRALGRRLEAFVRSMAQPDSQRLSMAREIREAHERQRLALKAGEGRDRSDGSEKETPGPTKDRGR